MKWLFVFFPLLVYAQDYPARPVDIAEIMDNAAPQEGHNDEVYENMLQALSHRLDLNTVTREQLLQLHLLSATQTEAILNYRSQTEKFYSVYELQVIPEIDHNSFSKIAPFLTVSRNAEKPPFLQRLAHEENKYLLMRWDRTLEKQKGYGDAKSPYEGSADRIYWRMRNSRPGDFSIGITGEKDPGEKIKWDRKTKGMDFLSAHFQLQNRGRLKNLIIGDFGAQFGQGLVLGTAFGIGKSAEAVSLMRRSNIGFIPFTSRYETGFFRGAAASFRVHKNITFHALFSRLHNDADSTFASSLLASGFHRSAREIAAQKTVKETNAAAAVQFETKNLDAGLILHSTRFDIPIQPNEKLYNQFAFSGKENSNAGVYLNYTFSKVAFFSEFTQTLKHGRGWTAGSLISLTAKLDMAVYMRKYDRDFYAFYSNAIAENTLPKNETGIYWGWKYQLNKKYSLSAYFDMFQFDWLKYRVYAPSRGHEWLLRFNFSPAKTTKLYLQFRTQNKPRNAKEGKVYQIMPAILSSFLANAEYSPHPRLKFRTRWQRNVFYQTTSYQGTLLLQDISYQLKKIQLTGRVALFDAEHYDGRIYAYEPDVLSSFSWPAYSDSGIRQLLMLEYRCSKKISLWIRWARSQFRNKDQIGSGGELIDGNSKNDIKMQALIRF